MGKPRFMGRAVAMWRRRKSTWWGHECAPLDGVPGQVRATASVDLPLERTPGRGPGGDHVAGQVDEESFAAEVSGVLLEKLVGVVGLLELRELLVGQRRQVGHEDAVV